MKNQTKKSDAYLWQENPKNASARPIEDLKHKTK